MHIGQQRRIIMDQEFHECLAEIKPYVLQLINRAESQRCAMWIKKLCEPCLSAADKKNRNLHLKLLLDMLKNGVLDGPFSVRPEDGPIKPLPSYMSIFFTEPTDSQPGYSNDGMQGESLKFLTTPAWVESELKHCSQNDHDYKTDSDENRDQQEADLSNSSRRLQMSKNDNSTFNHHNPEISTFRKGSNLQKSGFIKDLSTFRDEQSLIRMHEKELEMKTKVLQAQFHEEKMKLQHKHDVAVQKILDRKNSEIEELKFHFRTKERDSEEATAKTEKRVHSLMNEIHLLRDSKDKQIEELKLQVDEVAESAKTEYDAKVHDALETFERDKYELQKTHTKHIQQLLDDTNQRLMKMEEDHNAQTTATKLVISELESRVMQMSQETEALSMAKQCLSNEKQQTLLKLETAEKQLEETSIKYSELQKELATVKENQELQLKSVVSKYNANSEFIKQENNLALNKAQETARELEDQLNTLKHTLQDSEQQRTRELRERESLHKQDIMSIQHLHEKQTHQLRCEWDQDKSHHARELRRMEDIIRERDEQIARLTVQHKQCLQHAEEALEDSKKQVSNVEQKVIQDMKPKLEEMERELEYSKKRALEMKENFKSEIADMKLKHEEEIEEIRLKLEHDKAELIRQAIGDRDTLSLNYEKQLEDAERRLRDTLEEQERIVQEQKQKYHENSTAMEGQIRELREELVSANALRRQQLVELGLLREEERQKAIREHDALVSKLEAEIDRQRLEMHRQNAAELDRQAQKTKSRLENLEGDYKQRLERAYDRISELQQKENIIQDELSRIKIDSDKKMSEDLTRREEDMKKLRLQLESANIALMADLEAEREKFYCAQKLSQKAEFDLKDKVTKIKMEYEEKMKGLLPVSLKRELEDTIMCLRSQVSSLQQRVSVLQEDIDVSYKSRPFTISTPISPELLH